MHILSALIGILVPKAFAACTPPASLSGAPGLSQMWTTICGALPSSPTDLQCDPSENLLACFATKLGLFLNTIVGIVAAILIIYGGIRMIASNGNEEGMTHGKNILKYTAIGLVLYTLAVIIVDYVGGFLNTALS